VNKTGPHPDDIMPPKIIRKLKVEVQVLTRYWLEIHRLFSLKIVINMHCLLPQHVKFWDYAEK